MHSFKTEGIILKRNNVGEADRLLTIFTKHYGKIHVIAKGVRKISSRRGGNVEIFTHTILFLSQGKNFDLLSEAETIHSFQTLRKNLLTVAYAYKICELTDKLTAEKQEHEDLYNLLVNTLQKLNSNSSFSSEFVENFEMNLLKILGFWSKNRPFENIDLEKFIENIIEQELKSKNFLQKLHKNSYH